MSLTQPSREVGQETSSEVSQDPGNAPAPTGRTKEDADRVRERRVGRLERRWWGRAAVSLLIVWHLFALLIWLLPGNTPIVQACVGPVRRYLTATATAQSWNMFSPNPDKMDVYLEARVTFADGSVRPYVFPRMATMGYAARYREERWRKFVEVATHGVQPAVWAALARDAARVSDRDPSNRPVSVGLLRHWREIPPPGVAIPPYRVEPLQTSVGAFVLPVRAEDLNAPGA